MEILIIAIVLFATIVASSILDQLLPRASLPLLQIALGFILALATNLSFDNIIDSDLFLVMFIAPLLYNESRTTDNKALLENLPSILSLAIGLVIASALVVGFTLHLVEPSISLACAFAVGAALGPTDAVAVSSMGKDVKFDKRQKALLSGEALINDASGVVSFQFAIAAAVTGSFSLLEATKTFFIDFLGGFMLGIVIAIIYLYVTNFIRRRGLEGVRIHVLFEACLPFLVYFIAEFINVSGILAVVACGLFVTFYPQLAHGNLVSRMTPQSARISLVSKNVWDIIVFVLNGVIFTAMGGLLPTTLQPTLENATIYELGYLFVIVLIISTASILVRFVWIVVMDMLSSNLATRRRMHLSTELVRKALVTTLSGPKGAVALSIALTIPAKISTGAALTGRHTLIFLICSVVIVTLLLANFIVPLLAQAEPQEERENSENEVVIEMCRNVVTTLREHRSAQNANATNVVTRGYQNRIARIRRSIVPYKVLRKMRIDVLERQKEFVYKARAEDDVDRRVADRYLKRIKNEKKRLERRARHDIKDDHTTPIVDKTNMFKNIGRQVASRPNGLRSVLEFKIDLETDTVHYLKSASRSSDEKRAQAAMALLVEHKAILSALKSRKHDMDEAEGLLISSKTDTAADITTVIRTDTGKLKKTHKKDRAASVSEVQAEALRLELEQIRQMRKEGRISSSTARDLRSDVYLLQMGLSEL